MKKPPSATKQPRTPAHTKDRVIQRLSQLIDINSTFVATLEKDKLIHSILAQTKVVMDCQRSSILLIDESSQKLYFAGLSDESEKEKLSAIRLGIGEGVAGTVWSTGKPMIVNDAVSDPRVSRLADKRTSKVTSSLIAVPLALSGKIIGVIEAMNKDGDAPFDDFDLEIFQHLAVQATMAIDNANLYQMVITDSKTRLFTNRFFALRLDEEFAKAIRSRTSVSLVIFDLDHFKRINDTYGHQVGDLALLRTAQMIKDNCRACDIPCRFGGEEFTVILPETPSEGAREFAERLRHRLEAMEMQVDTRAFRMTISAGIATYPASETDSSEGLLKMADQALYYSKEHGRNQVTLYHPGMAAKKT